MSQISNTFILKNEANSDYECELKIVVTSYTKETVKKYDITYYYSTPEGHPEGMDNPALPFYNRSVDNISSVIVPQNALTETIVKFLMMNENELIQTTFTTNPILYRKNLINYLDSIQD